MELIGLTLLFLVALSVVILFTRGVFARDLTQALKRVNQQEQALQEKADVLEQRLMQMEREYQAKLKRAEAEAERLVQEAKHQAMNVRMVAIDEAKHRARQLLLEAEQGKAQLKATLTQEVNGKIAQKACESLRSLLPAPELAALHRRLVVELLEALPRVATDIARAEHPQITVMTAQPLEPTQAQQLTQWAAKVATSTPIHMETDPTLVAGCIVTAGTTVIDNSLRNRLSR